MRILIIGKYPPIEGGVSAHTYWLARGLGEAGHQVSVVTNADRVEEQYKLNLNYPNHIHEHDANGSHHHYHDRESKNVTIYSLQGDPPEHIPHSESFVTRLVSEGLRAIEEQGADVIYAHYLEPYGVAALMLKQLTGIPLAVRHAGSDIYRLLRHPEYMYVLGRVLQQADVPMVSGMLSGLVSELGIKSKVKAMPHRALPPQFTPKGSKFTFPKVWHKPDGVPLITYLGKATNRKGVTELLDALEKVEVDYRFVLFTQGPDLDKWKTRVRESSRLEGKVWFHEFVPPWTVPSVLRATDILVHLENRFPVAIHTPTQPYEAAACRTPMLLSGEMFSKLRRFFATTQNRFSVVDDPRETTSLTRKLTEMLNNAKKIHEDADAIYDEYSEKSVASETYVDGYLTLFKSVRGNKFTRFWRHLL